MSEKTRIIYYGLWMAHPLLQAAIAMVMFRRGLHRKFKFFFTYIVVQIASFSVIFPAYAYNHFVYFYSYWFGNAISVVLGFAVIYEIFLDVFRPFHTLRDLGTVLFKWAGLVMLLVAGVVSVSSRSGDLVPWMQAIVTTQRCVRIIQVGMVLFLLFFARYMGVSRRQQSFGIALGFGSFAVLELMLISSVLGDYVGDISANLLNMAAYNMSLGVWLGYSLLKNQERDGAATLLQSQRWEDSLSDLHHHTLPADSLIPMFEGMVDRALSRTQNVPVAPPPPAERAAAASGGHSD
jgi:hypothetical protein